MQLIIKVLLVSLLSLILSFNLQAKSKDPLETNLPELEVIPGAQWYWVGKQMAMNNIPMSVKMFTFYGSLEDVKSFYLSLLSLKGHGKLSDRAIGDLKILGYELDGIQYSVQIAQKGDSVDGKIVVTPTPLNYSSSKKTQLPIAPRSKVSSKLESIEYGRRSESLTIESSLGVDQLLRFYSDSLSSQGWNRTSGGADGRSGGVIGFQRGSELLQLNAVSLHNSNGTGSQALIHWLK